MQKLLQTFEPAGPTDRDSTLVTPATGWRASLPTLRGPHVILRQMRASDATSLHTLLTAHEVRRFMHEPPDSPGAFERFIAWNNEKRAEGLNASFAVTLKDFDSAIGLFQVRAVDETFTCADWGFALGSPFWGTGVFREGAELMLRFIFDTLHVHRLEALAAVRNGRANRALQKLGAVQEGVLRSSLVCNGECLDEVLYAILADDYHEARIISRPAERPLMH